MIRTLPAFILALALLRPLCAATEEPNQLDGNEALFTVLAAINAVGYDADLNSPTNHPLRKALREYLAKQDIPVLAEMKKFYAEHRQKDDKAELSQYISYALCVHGAPDFRLRFKVGDLPPEVVPLEGLSELLAAFHKQAHIAELWAKTQPAVDQMIGAYQPLISRGLVEANAYLRNPTSGARNRRFEVIVDVLGPPNQIQVRSFRDDYYVVVTPSAEPQADEVRHSYLHYLLDQLIFRNAEELNKRRALMDFAQGAPVLDDVYKDDYFLLACESLVKAVEARLMPSGKRLAQVNQALSQGFILTGAFFDALPAYEKQELAFRLYFKDLVTGIDLRSEVDRLDKVHFDYVPAVKALKKAPQPAPPPLTGIEKTLEKAEGLYKDRKLEESRAAYLETLKAQDQQGVHAKAYYGLARIAALQRDGELAERMFQKVLEMGPDEETRAWALVYLGRLSDAQGERDQAVDRYKAALAVKGVSDGARKAAEQGLKQSFSNQK